MATAVAQAINSAACLLDLAAVVVDGSLGGDLRAALKSAMACYSRGGVTRPVLLPGSIGPDARALGGALLPLQATFRPTVRCF